MDDLTPEEIEWIERRRKVHRSAIVTERPERSKAVQEAVTRRRLEAKARLQRHRATKRPDTCPMCGVKLADDAKLPYERAGMLPPAEQEAQVVGTGTEAEWELTYNDGTIQTVRADTVGDALRRAIIGKHVAHVRPLAAATPPEPAPPELGPETPPTDADE